MKLKMKVYAAFLAFLGILGGFVAEAGNHPLYFRKTLFAPAGQKMLKLEAPQGMCFLDPSYYTEDVLLSDLRSVLDSLDVGEMLAVFAPCYEAAGVSQGALQGALSAFGVVTWLNPQVGETTPLEMNDYLDMQEKGFAKWVKESFSGAESAGPRKSYYAPGAYGGGQGDRMDDLEIYGGGGDNAIKTKGGESINGSSTGKSALDRALTDISEGKLGGAGEDAVMTTTSGYKKKLGGMAGKVASNGGQALPLTPAYMIFMLPQPSDYKVDNTAHRGESGVTVGYSAVAEREYIRHEIKGVAGTTSLSRVPVAAMISWQGDSVPNSKATRQFMETFLAQQVALNR